MKPIFSENLLSHYLTDFSFKNITKTREVTIWIRELIDELDSGKFESLKEEEIKSRFVTIFFGDILGFNYGNSNEWQLREEKKSTIDGKKTDAALGYFFADKSRDDVRVVIEIKDAQTDLDEKQKRQGNNLTPVEQAFNYSYSMGGNCRWVIVSNIKETRFYHSSDNSKYQSFYLNSFYINGALNEEKLKELLFLFHKDRFIKKGLEKSRTDKLFEQAKILKPVSDKPIHIIDKLYYSLQRFKGFGFVNPNYIATIQPFNILDEHVWQYLNGELFTINGEIYELLIELNIENKQLNFSDKLQSIITNESIFEAKKKIEWIFDFLNKCLVFRITAIKDYKGIAKKRGEENVIGFTYRHQFHFTKDEGITKSIYINDSTECDCISCNYRSLDFNRLCSKLKEAEGNEDFLNKEYAFGNYLLSANTYKTAYNIYKKIEKQVKGKEGKGVEYFLVKMNIKLLHNLFTDYELADRAKIMNDIKSTDLDKVIYDEIEFDVDKEVKKYLLDVKENDFIDYLKSEIDKIVLDIEKLKELYERGGKRESGPDLPFDLSYQYYILFLHVNRNFIIKDVFSDYSNVVKKFFRGHIIHSMIPHNGYNLLNDFILTEAIIHIHSNELIEILKSIENIKIQDGTIEKILDKVNNFTNSAFIESKFSFEPYKNPIITEYLSNYTFESKYSQIFNNLFIVLSKLDISREQFFNNRQPIIKFLKVYNELNWFDLSGFINFILCKGNLFNEDDLVEILKIGVNGDSFKFNTFHKLIECIPRALEKFYPNYKINDRRLIKKALFNSTSEDDGRVNYDHLIYILNVCDENCRIILVEAFENFLDKDFNFHFYELLLRNSNYRFDNKGYFLTYSEYINNVMYRGDRAEKMDFYFDNYILIIYKLNIDFDRPELKIFTELNDFETWILNPEAFDYTKFDPIWLLEFNYPIVLNRLKGNQHIANRIEKRLRQEFDPILAEIKYKYFCVE